MVLRVKVLRWAFRGGFFFDPRDLFQVRYETVRRHRLEAVPVAVTAQLFGVSLPTAYQAHAAFNVAGRAGLLPKRRGPKQGHKLAREILAHIAQRRRERPDLRTGDPLAELRQRFGLAIHQRSLQRFLYGNKNCRAADGNVPPRCGQYEQLRPAALCGGLMSAVVLLRCWSCCLAHLGAAPRSAANAPSSNQALTDGDAQRWTAGGGVGVNHSAPDHGDCSCLTRALLRIISVARPISTSVSRRRGRSSRTAKARVGHMGHRNGPSASAGQRRGSTSSIKTSACPARTVWPSTASKN
jgi:transposase